MGGSVSSGRNNDELIDNLVRAKFIRSPDVERVMRAVDRGHFQQSSKDDWLYKDVAWRKSDLHISAPCIYSEVLEGLQLRPGHSFLNLGSGTGYLSTMAGLLVGPLGENHGVELSSTAVDYARERLEAFKKQRAVAMDAYDLCEPVFVVGDCLQLAPETRQYDRIYCGASCPQSHDNYLKQLLKVGGILVVPFNDRLVQITRHGEGLTDFQERELLPVSFTNLVTCPLGTPVYLPEPNAPSLQELSRFAIRVQLRSTLPTPLTPPPHELLTTAMLPSSNMVCGRKRRLNTRQQARRIFGMLPQDREEDGEGSDTGEEEQEDEEEEQEQEGEEAEGMNLEDDSSDDEAPEEQYRRNLLECTDGAIVVLCNPCMSQVDNSNSNDSQETESNDTPTDCQADNQPSCSSNMEHPETTTSVFQDKINALHLPPSLKYFLKYQCCETISCT